MDCKTKMCKINLCFFSIFFFITIASNAASIKGIVIDSYTQKSIPGAVVSIMGTRLSTVADADGKYIFTGLKHGAYSISAKFINYENSIPQQIILPSSDTIITFDVYLKPIVKLLNEVVIQGTKNKETDASARTDEKMAPNVINIISARTIESLPDLNVADVMQRVSGVSMLKNSSGSNSQMIIRGMPSRYNSTLVDGVAIPSTSTSDKSVSLDMFGSDLVGRIEVVKALTPDLEGDAIGGTVNIMMKQAPDTSFFKVQASTGYNQYFFNHDFLTFNSKTVAAKDFNEKYGSSYVPQLSDFPRQNLIINTIAAPPDLHGSMTFSRRFFKKRLGIMVAANVQNTYMASTDNNNSYSSNPNDYKDVNSLIATQWENQTYCKELKRFGGYTKIDYQVNNDNQISFYNSFFQLNELRAREVIDTLNENGRTVPGTGTVHSYNQTITDNSNIESAVLKGNHKLLENLHLDWTFVYSAANSTSPDYATVYLTQTIPTPGAITPKYLNYSGGIVRDWQWNTDEDKSAYLNINYKPTLFAHLFEFKAGGMARMKYRENYANEYDFDASQYNGNYPNPNILTVPVSVQNNQQLQGNAIDNPGNYKAWEDVEAVYGMVSTSFGKLHILTGIRTEFTYMTNDHNQNNIQIPVASSTYSYFDVLPSLHLNYKFNDKQNLRFSVYQAINRPNYTEVIPYSDPRPGGTTGNPDLVHTLGTCYDMRYEIYPQREEVFTAGLFYKKLTNPIEELITPGTESTSFQNIALCTNYGFELVGIKYFGDFGINGNYTYTNSQVNVPKLFNVVDSSKNVTTITRKETRPLVGQSPNLINLSVIYRKAKIGFKCSVVYTMQGSHVVSVSSAYGKDVYERNYHNLGITLEKRMYKRLILVAKASNLLNYPIERYTKDGYFVEKLNNYQNYFIGLSLTI